MEYLVANLAGKVRYEEFEGRKYLVAPLTMTKMQSTVITRGRVITVSAGGVG